MAQQIIAFEAIQHGEIQYWRTKAIDSLFPIPMLSAARHPFYCLLVQRGRLIHVKYNNRSSGWLINSCRLVTMFSSWMMALGTVFVPP
jgi:hypothetical protein